eukprot:TRINITY_DN555_c0_g1_i2.p1 TRINITY_DN555_c0_g1~~TRINITY_DN555_c0_g1_i2.p1  ORF type:complete len:668 (+),score=311.24 TRINITY_DN555_c0_g1_i2:49-2052(+)
MMRTFAALVVLPAYLAMAQDFPMCSVESPSCPDGLHCDYVAKRCYHAPRQLGEACGIESLRGCAEYDGNTTHPLECSTWCGVCVLKDELARREAGAKAALANRARHMKRVHANAERCGLTSNITFMNFEETIVSTMPIVYPHNDAQLRGFLAVIAKNGCTARPVGATHSSSPVIASASENATVGISLAEYIPDDAAWAGVLDEKASTVKAPAGWSLFQLYELTRPHGYFLPTQTAGPIFTLAGIVTNTVHGGVFNAGFLSEYVRSLRVAVWTAAGDMAVRVITSEAELRHWRNSFGMLGLITGVEFHMDKRDGFLVSTARHHFKDFTRDAVDQYFQDLEKDYIYSESFFNPYGKEINSVLFQKGKVVPEACNAVVDSSCTWDYPKARCNDETCCHYQYKFGDINLSQSCRAIYTPQKSMAEIKTAYKGLDSAMSKVPYFGAPDLPPTQNAEICILEWADKIKMGTVLDDILEFAFFDRTYLAIDSEVVQNGEDVNDGFYLRGVPHGIKLMAYFVPRENLFDMLSIISDVYDEVTEKSGIKQLGNAEFRFLNITDKMTLLPTGALSGQPKTGQYVNCEMVFNVYPGGDHSWATTLYKYEQKMRQLDGFLHTGKSFCYDLDSNGEMKPYQNTSCIKSIFNDEQKATFQTYRASSDPLTLFGGGAALEFF